MDLFYAPLDEIKKVRKEISDPFLRAETLADIFRINTLYMIKLAGSGHIGTSFSAMDIAAWLWLEEMENPNARDSKDSDIYFSSKGHDIPGLYSILIGLKKSRLIFCINFGDSTGFLGTRTFQSLSSRQIPDL